MMLKSIVIYMAGVLTVLSGLWLNDFVQSSGGIMHWYLWALFFVLSACLFLGISFVKINIIGKYRKAAVRGAIVFSLLIMIGLVFGALLI